MSLTTLDNCKSYLQIEDTSQDLFLNMLIKSVQKEIENYCNRQFDLQTYTNEQHKVNHKIFTHNYPIVSVEAIRRTYDGTLDIELTPNELNGSYRIHPNYVELLDMKYVTMSNKTMWAFKEESYVEIDYTAGWSQEQIPGDLTLAATKMVALEYTISRESRIGLESESVGGVKYTYYKNAAQSIPADIQLVLDR